MPRQGEFEESVELCLRVLRMKPWHFGALGGIVGCYAQLGKQDEAQKWASKAMPPPGAARDAWVQSMLQSMDAKLAEISGIAEA